MTEENKQFLKDNYLTMLDREMAEVIGVKRTTVSAWCRRLGLIRPPEIASKRKARVFTEERRQLYRELMQTNKELIKKRYKQGNKSHYYPIGTKVRDKRDGYWRIKVKDEPFKRENWEYLHRVVWEKHYGAIPPNHHIVFLDGNKDNLSIENLYMVESKVFAIMNRRYKFTNNPQETKERIKLAKLKLAISDVKRRKNGKS